MGSQHDHLYIDNGLRDPDPVPNSVNGHKRFQNTIDLRGSHSENLYGWLVICILRNRNREHYERSLWRLRSSIGYSID